MSAGTEFGPKVGNAELTCPTSDFVVRAVGSESLNLDSSSKFMSASSFARVLKPIEQHNLTQSITSRRSVTDLSNSLSEEFPSLRA
ncbi:MAG TPA: hypothetical protein VGI13_01210 [Candidatus Acidoferrum sp.]|jgi:hypothetical protein